MSKWGGKREGAGSGGKREGAGRPREKWNSGGRDTVWSVLISGEDGMIIDTQSWRVIEVLEDAIVFEDIETGLIYRFVQ